jgi:hypothetical protein
LREAYESGPDKAKIRAAQEHRRCIRIAKVRKQIGEYRDRLKAELAYRQEVDALTPYGKWAIPEYIVMCESGGSWSAANPSGAIGPYQLLNKGAVWPVVTKADKLEHHRIASDLWAGGAGASHWVCA